MRIPHFLHKFASPRYFYRISGSLAPWLVALFVAAAMVGLYIGLWVAPTHSEQGESYRIMYIHVPAASASLMVYMVMAASGLIFLVWRIKLADVIAGASAPVGASFTFLALVTGSIWGKPTWGTWWQWDARLTSELILLFLYLGYMALRAAIEDRQNAGRASAVLALVGVINIPIIHYSVEWWNTLHQGATISKMSSPTMEGTMLTGLLTMMAAYNLFFAAMVLVSARCQVLRNETRSSWVKDLPEPWRGGRLAWLLPALALAGVALHATGLERTEVRTPTQVKALGAGTRVTLEGIVEETSKDGTMNRFVLSDGKTGITVRFQGTLPRFFRLGWGARVVGSVLSAEPVFEAESVAALNLRDHSRYVLAAYLVALVIFAINLVSPYRCHQQARLAITRRLRREETA